MNEIRLEFNRYLLDAIGGQILDVSLFAWGSGFTKWMLGLCLVIGLFQSFTTSGQTLLKEWFKISIALWFCLAILGGVNYRSVPGLGLLDNVPANYQVKSQRPATLERAAYNWVAYKSDQLGKIILGSAEASGDLNNEVRELGQIQKRVAYAMKYCNAKGDPECLRSYLSGEKEREEAEAEEEASASWNPLQKISAMLSSAFSAFTSLYNPSTWLGFLLYVLNILRAFMSYFVLIGFGITAAMSLFLIKVLCVFMVIPSYRGRVIKMFKHTASTAMFGLCMNLILWISLILTKALNEATVNIIIQRITGGGSAVAVHAEVFAMMMSNFLTALVIVFMQIVALRHVPKLARNIIELSLEEVVNIGETLMGAAMGMAKVGASLLGGAAGAALTGGASLAAGVAGSAGKSLSGMGSQAASSASRLMGGPGSGPTDIGGSTGFSSGPKGPFGSGPSGGPGSGMAPTTSQAAMDRAISGEIKAKATTSGSSSSIFRDSDQVGDPKKENESLYKKEVGTYGRALSDQEARVKRRDAAKKAMNMARAYVPSAGVLASMAFDGMGAATGGDALASLGGGMKHVTQTLQSQQEDINSAMGTAGQFINEKVNNLNPLKSVDNEERAAYAEDLYRTSVGGRSEMDDVESSNLDSSLAAIGEGKASNAQMMNVLSMQNTKNLSEDQLARISTAREASKEFAKFAETEERISQNLIQKAQKEAASSKGISNSTIERLGERSSSGLVNYDSLASAKVMKSDGTSTSLGNNLLETAKADTDKALSKYYEKVQSGNKLSAPELASATRLYDSQVNNLVGDTDKLERFRKVVGANRDVTPLMRTRDDYTNEVVSTMKSLEAALADGELSIKLKDGIEMSLETQTNYGVTTNTGGFDGFYINGKAIASPEDYNKLDINSKRSIDAILDSINIADTDKEAQKKLGDLKVSSENLQALVKSAKKIRGF